LETFLEPRLAKEVAPRILRFGHTVGEDHDLVARLELSTLDAKLGAGLL
jgi:hypothetical protein